MSGRRWHIHARMIFLGTMIVVLHDVFLQIQSRLCQGAS